MKYLTIGCLIGILMLMSLVVLNAQDAAQPIPPDYQTIQAVDTVDATLEPLLTPEILFSATEAAMPTAEVVSEPTVVVSAQSTTEVTPVPLPDVQIVSPTSGVSVTIVPSQTPTSTATLALRTIEGKALYPNRVFGQAFIRVQAFSADNTLIGTVYTDATGRYTLVVPADHATRVEIDAPLYLKEILFLAPGIVPETITLRGGDLNNDACVGKEDIDILVRYYGGSFAGADLDGNGVVDVIDLTLLSSNYDVTCIPSVIIPTSTSSAPDATAESISIEDSAVATFPVSTESLATEEPLPTAQITSAVTLTLTPLPTGMDLPVEVTGEATLQS